MSYRIDRLEERIKTFIESSSNWLTGKARPTDLARQITAALENTVFYDEAGRPHVPAQITITLNPDQMPDWESQRELLDKLAEFMMNSALETGLYFSAAPIIHLEPDSNLSQEELRITAGETAPRVGETSVLVVSSTNPVEPEDPRPQNAFLIYNTTQIIPLRQVVINLGRRSDNHIVIEDPRVSRNHAQLRAVRGAYVLFDLNSTGGTFVNGQRILQQLLKPGDVITLAGVPLIYGVDSTGTSPNTATGGTESIPPRSTEEDPE